jgi:hypothetical protein
MPHDARDTLDGVASSTRERSVPKRRYLGGCFELLVLLFMLVGLPAIALLGAAIRSAIGVGIRCAVGFTIRLTAG